MTKYKLKYDLLGLKAGEVFELNDDRGEKDSIERLVFDKFFEEISGPWAPKYNSWYYYIEDDGYVMSTIWKDRPVDKQRFEICNAFRSEEEAKKTINWLKARATLVRDMKGFEPMEEVLRYVVYLDSEGDLLIGEPERGWWDAADLISFKNEEDAKESIKKHKTEWLTYWGVEEEE